ncbi:VOC family protein [Ravibacter arvi]|uniref:VOC family protein n=1 Tax=Ravibacter arvi TaxID=2051041 RepID=A0ABP8M0J3_9BACT
MNKQLYPCLWFDGNGREAAEFYSSVFDHGAIIEQAPMVSVFTVENTRLMILDGGPGFSPNQAVSYYVYCGSAEKLDRLYTALVTGGTVLMAPGKYEWSDRYCWLSDKYGVSWQLDADDAGSDQKIFPTLLFANEKRGRVKEAQQYYRQVFPEGKVLLEAPYPADAGFPEGTLLFTQFALLDCKFNAMSSSIPHDFDFTEGNSFVVECASQAEIDYYWNELTQGGQESMCGWLKDRFGVSWQIVPRNIGTLMNHPQKGPAVVSALMKMRKIDVEVLKNAG